jgi:hypothetical protein
MQPFFITFIAQNFHAFLNAILIIDGDRMPRIGLVLAMITGVIHPEAPFWSIIG